MTPYGIGLLATMIMGFLPWSFVFDAFGQSRPIPKVPLCMAIVTLLLGTFLYIDMLTQFAPEGHGWGMNVFLALTIHIGTIAIGGLVWGLIGQRAIRLFLGAPLIPLSLALITTLSTLLLSLIFNPPSP